jgi:hypothetical protein
MTDLTIRQFMIQIVEEDRQMVILALAELALSRPGWDYALGLIAEKLSLSHSHDDQVTGIEKKLVDGRFLFDQFKRLNADRVKATHGDL